MRLSSLTCLPESTSFPKMLDLDSATLLSVGLSETVIQRGFAAKIRASERQ